MSDLLSDAELKIELTLGPLAHATGQEPNFKDVFSTLGGLHDASLSLTGDASVFLNDLGTINADLHKLGLLLPNLELVMESDGLQGQASFAVTQDNQIISKSAQAPVESTQLQSDYQGIGQQTGYNSAWQDSVAGGGGADGHVNKNASTANVPDAARTALIKKALQLAGEEPTDANVAAVNTIVQNESNWNPNAINKEDDNAKAGHPSQGLMQTIPSTFQENAIPGYDTNINDPLSNLIAGIRYSKKAYGGVQNVPGVQAVALNKKYVGY